MMTDRLLKAGEAAARLGVSRSTLTRWRCAGLIPYIRAHPGAQPRYSEADIDALTERRSDGTVQQR